MDGKWGEYEGRAVGDRRLDSLLGVRGNIAFYLTQSAARGGDQLIELVSADAESEAAMASWNRARELSDEQLLVVHATGKAELDGTRVAYAVLDLPEDDLGEILARRKLDETEARSMFSVIAGTLQALHQRDLAHGAVTPSNIFVVRDEIRLSVDTLAPAGKHGKERDLQQFGATLVKALTGYTDETLVDAPAIARAAARLPPPFRQIAAGCLGRSSHGKWTAARIVETLAGRPPETMPRTRVPWLIMAGAGIVVVVLLFYLLFHEPSRNPAPTKAAMPGSPAPVRTGSAAPREPALKPRAQKPQPAPATTGAADRNRAQQKTGETSAESWAVIAGAYAYFDAAQKHADIYRQQFPQLQPRVFPPEGQGRRHLIVLASGLTQEAAERLRRDLIEQGAPPDTYVTKLME